MQIYFRTRKLQKECSILKEMHKRHGRKRSRKLSQRLNELKAADNLQDISHPPPPRLHELTGKRMGQFSVDLDHPCRLLFIPANDPVPVMQNGVIDRSRVTEIEVIEITDPH